MWDSIPSLMKEIDSINEFKHMLLNLRNLICDHADFAKFIYKILDICSPQKKKKIHICIQKYIYV